MYRENKFESQNFEYSLEGTRKLIYLKKIHWRSDKIKKYFSVVELTIKSLEKRWKQAIDCTSSSLGIYEINGSIFRKIKKVL